MRILHISTRLILGGSQENTIISCEGQARLGHEVHLAFGPIHGPEGSMLPRVEAFNARCAAGTEMTTTGSACGGIRTHTVTNLVREVSPVTDFRCYHELRRLVRRVEPDVVHTHSSKAGILGRAAAWDESRAGCRVVHTIHGPPFMPLDGGPLKRLKRRAANMTYTLAERWAAGKCHAIVSVADAMTVEFLGRGIGRQELYTTVRSGMELDGYLHAEPGEGREEMRRKLGFADDDFVIGTVARLAEHKGHDDLLDALGDVMKTDRRLKLLWVGDGWWRDRLCAKACAMGLTIEKRSQEDATSMHQAGAAASSANGQIVLTGLIRPERVASHIRAMDVLAHPSYREGLPRTVPQALLCGVCPVAYDVDGTGEACIDGKTGQLVRVGDRASLRDALLWLRDHPSERLRMAGSGREFCAREFSAELMVERLERVYQESGAVKQQRVDQT